MKKLKPKPYQFWAWCSTLTILAGAITAALGDILGETWTVRAGDTCTSFAIEAAGTTEMDFTKLQQEEEVKHVVGDF